MNTNLLNIVKRIIAEQGEDILDNPQRLKAFFLDMAKDEPKHERVAFGRCMEMGAYRELKIAGGADERQRKKAALANQLNAQAGIDKAHCADALDLLEAAVFGAVSGGQGAADHPKAGDNCKKCGKELQAGWKACPHCMTEVGQKGKTCAGCGSKLDAGWKACTNCGLVVGGTPQASWASPPRPEAKLAERQEYDAESDFEVKTLDYGKSVEIIKYLGSKSAVRIPPKIKGLPVTQIGKREISTGDLGVSELFSNFRETEYYSGAFCSRGQNKVIMPSSVTIPSSVIHISPIVFDLISVEFQFAPGSCFFTHEDFITKTIGDGAVEIVAYRGNLNVLRIPSEIRNLPVTRIGDNAFYHERGLKSIEIPNSVVEIGDGALNFHYLTSITICNNVSIHGKAGLLYGFLAAYKKCGYRAGSYVATTTAGSLFAGDEKKWKRL